MLASSIIALPQMFPGPVTLPDAAQPMLSWVAQYRATDPVTGVVTIEEGPIVFATEIPDGVPSSSVVNWEDVISYWIDNPS